MFVLAHLSDLHLAARPRLTELAGKRGLGFINWQRGRKYIHRVEALEALTRDLKACAVDHIAVTGDLVNLSLPGRIRPGAGMARPARVSTRRHRDPRQSRHLRTAGGARASRVLGRLHARGRRRGKRHISVSAPARIDCADRALLGAADGAVSGDRASSANAQLSRFATLLEETRGLFRVVLIHHPPESPPNRYLRRLTDADAISRCAGQARRRTCSPRPRPLPFAHLARRAGQERSPRSV